MKAAIYARVSRDDLNMTNQITPLRNYCKLKGWKIFKEYKETASGILDDRPVYNQLLKDAAACKFNAVVVFKFDRFARSAMQLLESLDMFRRRGIEFVSISENIDTTTAMGKVVFTILAAFAEFERNLISERTKAGLDTARRNGKVLGRPRAHLDMPTLRKLRANGLPYRAIAKQIGMKPGVVYKYLRPVYKRVSRVNHARS